MKEIQLQAAHKMQALLFKIWEEASKGKREAQYVDQSNIQVKLIADGVENPLQCFGIMNGAIFVAEKMIPKSEEKDDESVENSYLVESNETYLDFEEPLRPLPLPVAQARQLLSYYSLAHNPYMCQVRNDSKTAAILPPLWVRCDGSDPEGTCWLGAVPIVAGDGITGISFQSVTCKEPAHCKADFITLSQLQRIHKERHHSSSVTMRGFARYDLLGATIGVDNSIIECRSSVMADFTWNNADSILQRPPLTSSATLNIKRECGDTQNVVHELYIELEFLLVLAKGLKTGETDWPESLQTKSAVELVQAQIDDLKSKLDGFSNLRIKKEEAESEKVKSDTAAFDSTIKTNFIERSDLDFAEQLWCIMRKSVSSYQDVVDCFTMVVRSLKLGEIQPWIHRGSSSLLSKMVKQSYDGTVENIALKGLTPIQMFLEIGLDKLRKDYVNYFIGQELTTLNYLNYFLSTSVDLEEQVHQVQKLHHMLEIVVNCHAFVKLQHDSLFLLTQSCLKYYKEQPFNEHHVFHLPIRPTAISAYYQNESPQVWRVEMISGHGQKEVKTICQFSTKPPVNHVTFNTQEISLDTTVSGDTKENLYFTTVISCSPVYF